ncbi:MAG: hypothetical protein AAF438_12955 [Pseudomonadota bacterium]
MTRLVGLMAFALFLSGCLSHSRMPASNRYTASFEHKTEDIFQYSAVPLNPQFSDLSEEDNRHYQVQRMVFSSFGDNGQEGNLVTADFHKSTRSGAQPLVIVLPIWGTYTFPSVRMVGTLRKKSRGRMNVLRIHGPEPIYKWSNMEQAESAQAFAEEVAEGTERVRNTVIDLRRLLDWAQDQPGIDSDRVALIGFSMGAVVSSIAISNEPRFSRSVLVMGGANPSEIFAHCDGKLGDTREVVSERFGWDRTRYQETVAEVLEFGNVMNYAGRVDPRGVLMIEAGKDDCMPESSRRALWEAMGQPARITLNYGHKMSFMAMTNFGLNLLPRQVYRFLRNNL